MKILADVDKWIPEWNTGATKMMDAILTWLEDQGHVCHVTTSHNTEIYREYDWILTHLNHGMRVSTEAKKQKVKVGQIIHFDQYSDKDFYKASTSDLLIYNSNWMSRARWRGDVPSKIIVPPVWREDYIVPDGEKKYITLVNMNDNKGGNILLHLAKMFPKLDFLAVEGAYGDQVRINLPNVLTLPHQLDMKKVYSRTKILLMLSEKETWGRVAIEAMCSGIPVISSLSTGLIEACGSAAIFLNRNSVRQIGQACEKLLSSPAVYRQWSQKGLERSKELETLSLEQLKGLERYMLDPKGVQHVVRKRFFHKDRLYPVGDLFYADEYTMKDLFKRGFIT